MLSQMKVAGSTNGLLHAPAGTPGYVRSKAPERPKLVPLVPVIDAILEAAPNAGTSWKSYPDSIQNPAPPRAGSSLPAALSSLRTGSSLLRAGSSCGAPFIETLLC
jgi:hypothetical protein